MGAGVQQEPNTLWDVLAGHVAGVLDGVESVEGNFLSFQYNYYVHKSNDGLSELFYSKTNKHFDLFPDSVAVNMAHSKLLSQTKDAPPAIPATPNTHFVPHSIYI